MTPAPTTPTEMLLDRYRRHLIEERGGGAATDNDQVQELLTGCDVRAVAGRRDMAIAMAMQVCYECNVHLMRWFAMVA